MTNANFQRIYEVLAAINEQFEGGDVVHANALLFEGEETIQEAVIDCLKRMNNPNGKTTR
jgi:hypothetical protein